MARCDNCGRSFENKYQLGPHKRRCWNRQLPLESDFSDDDEPIFCDVANPEVDEGSANVSYDDLKLTHLAQRPREGCWGEEETASLQHRPVFLETCATYDYAPLQKRFKTYVRDVMQLCSPQYWEMFETVMHQANTVADKVLRTTSNLLAGHTKSIRLGHRWPRSTRTLRSRMIKKLGSFWDNVQETYYIDVKQFGLPGLNNVPFTFIDPIYVWIKQCEELQRDGHEFHWNPKVLRHPRTKKCAYGGGIQYGMLMQTACENTPAESRVALLNLSWDAGDTGYKTRSACPICVQVMNVNSSSTKTIGLVGYLPHAELGDAYCTHSEYKRCQEHILQVTSKWYFVSILVSLPGYYLIIWNTEHIKHVDVCRCA